MRVDAGTRALVTGASKGIGKAIAEALLARGATVGLAARGVSEPMPRGAVALPCDVADAGSIGAAVERFAAAGGLDLVVATRASPTTGASPIRTRRCTSR